MDERLRFVARLLEGEAMSGVCREFGISRKTGYKIFDRYKDHGLEALSDQSRRPVRYVNQLDTSKNLAKSSSFWFSEEKRSGGGSMRGEPGFFDVDESLKELSAKGDDPERLNAIVDFEIFRADLEGAVPRSDRFRGGRPPYDQVLMFRVSISAEI